jgi:hypothetical protein
MALGKKTGGRKRGTPNKATADVRSMAKEYGAAAIERLADLMKNAESEQAQIAAAKELLDRGYGKSTQPIAGDPDMPPVGVCMPTVIELVAPDEQGSD